MANIENPAAIFSAEGLKMFIEALTGVRAVQERPNYDVEADKLVKEYLDQEPGEDKTAKMDRAAETVYNYIQGLEGMLEPTTNDIQTHLAHKGITDYQGKRMGALMRGVMRRYPNVKKTDNKTYFIEETEGLGDE